MTAESPLTRQQRAAPPAFAPMVRARCGQSVAARVGKFLRHQSVVRSPQDVPLLLMRGINVSDWFRRKPALLQLEATPVALALLLGFPSHAAAFEVPPPTASSAGVSSAVVSGAVTGASTSLSESTAGALRAQIDREHNVYLDIKVDGKDAGRIVVELFVDVPVGAQRFADLAQERDGVGYRLSKFDLVSEDFVRSSGLRSLTYDAAGLSNITGGDTTELLEAEMDVTQHRHTEPGIVSLVVRTPKDRPVKERLVAYNGKLITVQDKLGDVPNGTGFHITLRPAPDLDATNLVVGHVTNGMEVVEQLSKLPAVKANKSSPYFQIAKLAGDKRADVAEKGFGRPFAKVLISDCGIGSSY